MKAILLALILTTTSAKALSSDDQLHLAAHAGTSFTIQTLAYGVNKQVLSKRDAEIAAAFETLIIGLLYKMNQNAGKDATLKSESENALGVGLAIGAHYTFEF